MFSRRSFDEVFSHHAYYIIYRTIAMLLTLLSLELVETFHHTCTLRRRHVGKSRACLKRQLLLAVLTCTRLESQRISALKRQSMVGAHVPVGYDEFLEPWCSCRPASQTRLKVLSTQSTRLLFLLHWQTSARSIAADSSKSKELRAFGSGFPPRI